MVLYKKVFLPVNAQLGWLDNVNGVQQPQFSLLLIGHHGLGHFFRHQPLLPIGWRFCSRCANGRKMTNLAPPTLGEALAASQSIFIMR
jgi:hypothetical protein